MFSCIPKKPSKKKSSDKTKIHVWENKKIVSTVVVGEPYKTTNYVFNN